MPSSIGLTEAQGACSKKDTFTRARQRHVSRTCNGEMESHKMHKFSSSQGAAQVQEQAAGEHHR